MTTTNATATADIHDALAAVIRAAAPAIHDAAYLAAQLLNDRYWALRYVRHPEHSGYPTARGRADAIARHYAASYATDRTLAAVIPPDAYARVMAAADLQADRWERASWARDEAQRAEVRADYPEWLADALATRNGI